MQRRLELARRIIESVGPPEPMSDALKEGVKRIEDMATGRVKPLTEAEFEAALE